MTNSILLEDPELVSLYNILAGRAEVLWSGPRSSCEKAWTLLCSPPARAQKLFDLSGAPGNYCFDCRERGRVGG